MLGKRGYNSMSDEVNYNTVVRIARSIWPDDQMPDMEDLTKFAELLYAIGFTDGQRSMHRRARFID